MKRVLLNLIATVTTAFAFGQVTTNGGSGLSANYPSLADAITALNGATITSPVIITLAGNETAPAGGYLLTASGTVGNPITLQSNIGVIVTASGSQASGSLSDAIFKVSGGDFITIKDFTIRENTGNTTTDAGTNNMTEWGIAVLPSSATNGAKNISLTGNIITLNKSYVNSFGIYSNTAHTTSDVTAEADITSADGVNSDLKIQKNMISNVNIPIAIVGSPSFPGSGLIIGGSANGNSLTEWGVSALYSNYARLVNKVIAVSNVDVVAGIIAVNQAAPEISFNQLNNTATGNTDGYLIGIYTPTNGSLVLPNLAHTSNISNNSFQLISTVNGSSTSAPLISVIRTATANNFTKLQINGNIITKIEHSANAVGADSLIYNLASPLQLEMNNNQFTSLQVANTGTLAFFAIHGRVFMPENGTQTVSGNIISQIDRNSTGPAIALTTCVLRGIITSPPTAVATDGSETGSVFTASNNNFNNIRTNGGGFSGFVNFDGKVSLPTLAKNFTGNSISDINTQPTTSTITIPGGITLFTLTNRGAAHTVSGNTGEKFNTVNNITPTSSGLITGLQLASFSTGMAFTVENNIFRNWDGGAITGLSLPTPADITNNSFTGIIGRQTTGTGITLISMGGIPLGGVVNVSKNKIGDITNLATGVITAMNFGTSPATNTITVNVINNLIGDLKTPVATNINAIAGIIFAAGATTADVAHNTIYLNATSSSITTFGTSCILFNSTNTSIKLRNNILMNLSTPAQEGLNSNANGVIAALRRSTLGTLGIAPANYNIESNNNLFYVNSPAGTNNHLCYAEGGIVGSTTITNPQNTFAQMKAFMANRDQASVTENTNNSPFKSLDANSPDFLHVDPRFIFTANNAGMPIAAITADFDGEARNAATPDMGADEYLTNADAWLLPVTLATLNGKSQQGGNLLTWVTVSEQNNRGFDIQRSANGVNFTTIGFAASKAQGGSSQQALTYQFTDTKVNGSNLYYRLMQTDLDGKKQYSNMVVIKTPGEIKSGEITIFPNPVVTNTMVQIQAKASDLASISVTDAGGRILMQRNVQVFEGNNTIGLNLQHFAGGVYYINVKLANEGKQQTLHLIKQ